jgi:hypothetical protein
VLLCRYAVLPPERFWARLKVKSFVNRHSSNQDGLYFLWLPADIAVCQINLSSKVMNQKQRYVCPLHIIPVDVFVLPINWGFFKRRTFKQDMVFHPWTPHSSLISSSRCLSQLILRVKFLQSLFYKSSKRPNFRASWIFLFLLRHSKSFPSRFPEFR